MLVRHGYGVLLYDRRGEGHSEGDPNSWGWDFDKDIRAGVEFLQHRADVDPTRIGGLGLSVGGEMLLDTAAETKELAAIVSEGAGPARWARSSRTPPGSTACSRLRGVVRSSKPLGPRRERRDDGDRQIREHDGSRIPASVRMS